MDRHLRFQRKVAFSDDTKSELVASVSALLTSDPCERSMRPEFQREPLKQTLLIGVCTDELRSLRVVALTTVRCSTDGKDTVDVRIGISVAMVTATPSAPAPKNRTKNRSAVLLSPVSFAKKRMFDFQFLPLGEGGGSGVAMTTATLALRSADATETGSWRCACALWFSRVGDCISLAFVFVQSSVAR